MPIVEFDYQPGASYEYAPVFDHLIEYVADRRAMEIMKALGYDPHEYLRFLHRLRAYRDRYPSSAEEPYGWIDGRIAALEQLRAPTEAAFYVQYKESGQKKRCDLDADDQYNLVMVADIYLKPQERGLISEWLAAPDNRYLNDLLNDFSEASQKRIGEYILGVLTRRYGPFWQLQLHSAPDVD